MKAIVYKKYGGPEVVHMAEVAKPSPKANEVLIRVHATTVSSGDWRARSLDLPKGFGLMGRLVFGVFGPRHKILGTELAGVVEAVGTSVSRFSVGDEVFAFPSAKMGCHAEYVTMKEDGMIAFKPENLSFEQAAAISFGGTTALSFLRTKGHIKRGDRVLIIGASGSVGSAAVEIAKHFGAHVTGVASAANLDLVRSLGADEVIDYKTDDFTKNGQTYDIILAASRAVSMAEGEASLRKGGRILAVMGTMKQMIGRDNGTRGSGKKSVGGVAPLSPDDMRYLAMLADNGEFTPVIDRSYPLEQARDAHAHVDSGRKKGNVVLTVAPEDALFLAA